MALEVLEKSSAAMDVAVFGNALHVVVPNAAEAIPRLRAELESALDHGHPHGKNSGIAGRCICIVDCS